MSKTIVTNLMYRLNNKMIKTYEFLGWPCAKLGIVESGETTSLEAKTLLSSNARLY
jgi:hypothetical protein